MNINRLMIIATINLICFTFKAQQIIQLGTWANNANFGIKYYQNRLITTTTGNIEFLDVTNPTNPVSTSAFISSPNGFSNVVESNGNYAYFAGGMSGRFRIADITNINLPVETFSGFKFGGVPQIAIQGNYAFIPAYNDTLYSIDITNKSNPTILNKLFLGYQPSGIAINGNYAYVSTTNGIKIINIFNPSSMSIINTFGSSYYAKISADLPNNRLFLADYGSNGFVAIDISNPINLATSFHSVGGGLGNVTYNNGFVFQLSNGTVDAYQINANSGTYLCSFNGLLNGQINGIDSKDSVFYVSTTNYVYVFKYSTSAVITNLKNSILDNKIKLYPNPCNNYITMENNRPLVNSTVIIHNSLGLVIKKIDCSLNTINKFDLSELSSGIYFLSIKTGYQEEKLKFIKE